MELYYKKLVKNLIDSSKVVDNDHNSTYILKFQFWELYPSKNIPVGFIILQ